MVLYASFDLPRNNWIVEAELCNTDISDIVFRLVGHRPSSEAVVRREQIWKKLTSENPNLYDDELISIRELRQEDGRLYFGIRKSGYKEHHGSCPFEGERDEWTERFFPYGYSLENGVAVPKIPNFQDLSPSFAVATIVETSDKKLVYLVRSGNTDNYKNRLSLNSGGRINGHPHKMVDELVQDSSAIYRHITGMLQQEYSDLEAKAVLEHKLVGVSRSLDDLDVTLCAYTKVDLTYDQLSEKLKRQPKYSHISFVSADSDGIIALMTFYEAFPATIFPAIVQTATIFEVDPKKILKHIKQIA